LAAYVKANTLLVAYVNAYTLLAAYVNANTLLAAYVNANTLLAAYVKTTPYWLALFQGSSGAFPTGVEHAEKRSGTSRREISHER